MGEMSSAERQDTAESAQRPCLLAALNLIGCRTLKSGNLAAALRSECKPRPNAKFLHGLLLFLFDVSLYSISIVHYAVFELGALGSKQLTGSCSRPQHPTQGTWTGMLPRDAAHG